MFFQDVTNQKPKCFVVVFSFHHQSLLENKDWLTFTLKWKRESTPIGYHQNLLTVLVVLVQREEENHSQEFSNNHFNILNLISCVRYCEMFTVLSANTVLNVGTSFSPAGNLRNITWHKTETFVRTSFFDIVHANSPVWFVSHVKPKLKLLLCLHADSFIFSLLSSLLCMHNEIESAKGG